jgi:hypothetical protein
MNRFVSQSNQYFVISADRQGEALTAIKALAKNEDVSKGDWYEWVDPNFVNSSTLDEALRCWRWEPVHNETGAIVGLNFRGHRLGHERVLFETLAPFTECGSFIELKGNKGVTWHWYFENGTCGEKIEQSGQPEMTATQALEMCRDKLEALTTKPDPIQNSDLQETLRIIQAVLQHQKKVA